MADAEKKTKREKLLEKEEKKREKRIMKEKSKQYDGGFTARCVALLLGFVLGVAGTIGGAAGAGYYIVSHKSVKEVAGAITPVPGGVGLLTVAMLMENVVRAAEMQLQA